MNEAFSTRRFFKGDVAKTVDKSSGPVTLQVYMQPWACSNTFKFRG